MDNNMNESRTKKSLQNAFVALFIQALNAIVGVVSRTIFIKILGNDYLSVNGLFSNILTLLSFAELGIGNAIIFALYKPVVNNDEEKIRQILKIYKYAFLIISMVIIGGGALIIPFLKYLVTDVPDISENIVLIYSLFVLNTASTYFFSYKNAIIIANQRNYVVITIKEIVTIGRIAFQIVFLLLTHNYIFYLLLEIGFSLVTNLACTLYANRHYPYIKMRCDTSLPKEERNKIFRDVKSLFVYKGGAAILNGTDNIIISLIIATAFVGICSNYVLVIGTINGVVMQICNSVTASIGNHNVTSSPEEKEKKFREINSICFIIFSFCSVCLAVLLNPLIETWLGIDYLLSQWVVIALVLPFLLTGMNQIVSTYRMTLGLFKQARFIPLFAALINIVLSFVFGYLFGLIGVFIATSVAKLLTFSLFDPILVYKNGFETKCNRYFLKL